MIPNYFVTEFPERCGQLLATFERQATQQDLVSSFALLAAAAAFTITFGRMTEPGRPLGRPRRNLFSAIKKLDKRPFLEGPFWHASKPQIFRYAKIVNSPEYARDWQDAFGNHPLNSTESKDCDTVLRTIRHALAHGNVVYLDEKGDEAPDNKVHYIALLAKHQDGKSHRVVIFDEEDFLLFVKRWIDWIGSFTPEHKFVFAEAA